MGTTTLRRLTAGALMSAMAGIAFATPASALEAPDPEGAGFYSSTAGGSGTSLTDDGWELAQVATGALGGLLVAGMGVAAVAGLRRHQGGAHPA